MQIISLNNQSLLDISIQYTGKAENFLKIAMANNLVPTEPIVPGTNLVNPATVDDVDADIVRYYNANDILPATALSNELTIKNLNCEEKLYNCFKN